MLIDENIKKLKRTKLSKLRKILKGAKINWIDAFLYYIAWNSWHWNQKLSVNNFSKQAEVGRESCKPVISEILLKY